MTPALAMVLTAAMAVPGNGPEMVSGEMESPGLDLSGEWEAVLLHDGIVSVGGVGFIRRKKFSISWEKVTGTYGEVIDEGSGNLRMGGHLGIYQQDGDYLRICRGEDEHRPTSFHARDGQELFILRRVKPRKVSVHGSRVTCVPQAVPSARSQGWSICRMAGDGAVTETTRLDCSPFSG